MKNLKGADLPYWERNQLVCYLSKMFESWIEEHPKKDESWDPEWKNIIFIRFPEGLFSWHIHMSELKYFSHLKFRYGDSWDGSSTEKKYKTLLEKVKEGAEAPSNQKNMGG